MLQLPRVLSCFLVIGWAMATVVSSKQIFPCELRSKNVAALRVSAKSKGKLQKAARPSCVAPQCVVIQDGPSLVALGSAVGELSDLTVQHMPTKAVLDAMKVPGFARHLETVSRYLKSAFVLKMVEGITTPNDLVKYIPNGLLNYVPKAALAPGNAFDVQELNGKSWTSEQAAMLFDDLIKKGTDFNSLSHFVLSGFTCTMGSTLNTKRFKELTQAMKRKDVQLNKSQLSCVESYLKLHKIKKNFKDYPSDLLLFSSPSTYEEVGNCKEFITRVGKANIEVLPKGSPQRKKLLTDALGCLNLAGSHVSKTDANILGHLVCDLSAKHIAASGNNLVQLMTQCQALNPDQIKAIQAIISGGNTIFGPPSNWTTATLEKLSGLFHVFDHNIMINIPSEVLTPWLKCYIHISHRPREQLARVLENLYRSRRRRAAACPPGKEITKEVAMDDLMPLDYSPEDLRLCLTPSVIDNYLGFITQYSFTEQQLRAIKGAVDERFPNGYPDSILHKLGGLLGLVTPDYVARWNITSPQTLISLLDELPRDNLAIVILKKYNDHGGVLDSNTLNAMDSRYICLLNEGQLSKIETTAIKTGNTLDISKCPQITKDILYPKAKGAFLGLQKNFSDYYNLMQPSLGGAPKKEIMMFVHKKPNMDIDTFMSLREDVLLALTTADVKSLLGVNLWELKTYENVSPIKEWIRKQKQSDLDTLAIGLRGGIKGSQGPSGAAPRAFTIPAWHVFSALLLTLLPIPVLL